MNVAKNSIQESVGDEKGRWGSDVPLPRLLRRVGLRSPRTRSLRTPGRHSVDAARPAIPLAFSVALLSCLGRLPIGSPRAGARRASCQGTLPVVRAHLVVCVSPSHLTLSLLQNFVSCTRPSLAFCSPSIARRLFDAHARHARYVAAAPVQTRDSGVAVRSPGRSTPGRRTVGILYAAPPASLRR